MQLDVCNVSKSFSLSSGSRSKAVDGISFTAVSGEPFGLLGRNGAGKTTTMRMIMNIFAPDSGEVLVDGKPMNDKIKRGYLPEERGLYRKISVIEQMIYFGRLKGLSGENAKSEALRLLNRLEMREYEKALLETLSKGNQQKIQLAVALMNEPDIIILDEPFSGLDPVNAAQLKELIREQSERGAIVLFSSHQMSAVEDFCESIVMIDKGRKVLDGKLSEIKRSYPKDKVRVVLDGELYDDVRFTKALEGLGSAEITKKGALIRLRDGVAPSQLMCRVLYSGLPVLSQEIVEPTLEDIFVEKAGKEEAK